MIKRIQIVLVLMLGLNFTIQAQQEALYTQYWLNMLAVNPAYAGSRDALTLTALYRNQWVGIEGAPVSTSITGHSPFLNENMGIGFGLLQDNIGPMTSTYLSGDLSGRIQLTKDAYLSAGIKLTLGFVNTDFSDIITSDPDPTLTEDLQKTLPNIGLGIYYYSTNYYLGVSAPKVIENELFPSIEGQEPNIESRHLFISGGMVFDIAEGIQFKPSALVRLVSNAPTSLESNLSFGFSQKFWLGLFYRYEDAVGMNIAVMPVDRFTISYSYDYTTSRLSDISTGSHEIALTYDFVFKSDKIKSPRYF